VSISSLTGKEFPNNNKRITRQSPVNHPRITRVFMQKSQKKPYVWLVLHGGMEVRFTRGGIGVFGRFFGVEK